MDHFRVKEAAGVKVIECLPLKEAGFIAGFSTRVGGVSRLPQDALNLGHFGGDSDENVAENRRRFLAALGLNPETHIATAKQIHSADHHCVKDLGHAREYRATCDALLTDATDLLLGIQTADCLPVLIVDPKRRVVAGVHAGWRGTLAHIVDQTLIKLATEYRSDPADCLAATGPAIGQCCFEVGPEVKEAFEAEFNYGSRLFDKHQPNGKSHMDLRAANREQLLAAGVQPDNISIWPDCTRCQMDLYFSYRGEIATGAVGRLLSVVGIA